MRLFNRLLVLYIPVMIFFLVILESVVHHVAKNSLITQIEMSLDAKAQLHQARLQDYLSFIRERLGAFNSRLLIRKVLAAHPDGQLPSNRSEQLQGIVNGTKELIESFEEIYLISTENIVAASTQEAEIGKSFNNLSVLEQLKRGPVMAQVHVDANNELKLIHAIELELKQKVVGYLVVINSARQLQSLAEDRIGLGDTGEAYLIKSDKNNEGQLVYLSPLRFSDTQTIVSPPQEDKLARMALTQKNNQIFKVQDYRGEKVIASTRYFNSTGWGLVVKIDESEALNDLQYLYTVVLFSSIAVIVLLIIASIMMARALSSPLEQMAKTAQIVEQGKLDQHFTNSSIFEVNFLAKVFNQMLSTLRAQNNTLETKVKDRTEALQKNNIKLSNSIENLKLAQSKLVESEKMAALGGLVAGIAHEVNTPIGVGLGAATHLQTQVKQIHLNYNNGSLTESDFEELLNSSEHAMSMIVSNLTRSAELIRSFKRVAVDQSNEQVIKFNLPEYIDEVLTSLKPKYRNSNVNVNFEGDSNITVVQSPGLFAQIVTNLTLNAVAHAFEQQPNARINVSTRKTDQEVILSFKDNGCGMNSKVCNRIFEPFFTTKRGQGGSGLGLHIVYNIVMQKLHGQINVHSLPGEGSNFEIRFPT